MHLPWLGEALALLRQVGDAVAIHAGQWISLHVFQTWFPESALPHGIASITTLTGTGLMLLLMSYVGLNANDHSILNIRETRKILRSWLIASVATLLVLYLARIQVPRLAWLTIWTMALPFLLLHRDLFWHIHRWLHRRSIVKTSAIIYGTGSAARMLNKKLGLMPEMGVHVAGFIDDDPRRLGEHIDGLPVLGNFLELTDLLRLTGSKRLYVALPHVPRRTITDILAICHARDIEFQIVPNLRDMALPHIRLEEIDGIPLLGVTQATLPPWRAFEKRAADILLGSLFLILCAPLLLAGIAATRISTGGPILQRFRRVGRNGKLFHMLRLRIGPKSEAPPSRWGGILHRLSIDAMPKLLNVVRGDMSLVGPKPARIRDVARYNEFHHLRLNVRPGLTGLWQILPAPPSEGDDSFDIDLQYIHNQSLLLDLSILLETVRHVFARRQSFN